jgi:endonuclease G
VASYNFKLNVPNWVSWSLSADWFGDVPRYDGRFIEETLLPSWVYHPDHDDYTNSGYDRGHMVRSEERTKTEQDNKATFYMSNILPQRPDLNRGVWLDFERYCETLCKDSLKQLFIIAGPVFVGKVHSTIGHSIAVPDSCFKIVVVLNRGQKLENVTSTTEVLAVVMPNTDGIRRDDWTKYRSNVDQIETLTGYNFLDYVKPAIQAVIEAK